ncbi:methyltransferase [Rhodoblastus sphagnicola]|uniref:Methyltransferase n=1 Tax=Rhodoblastus sphagnicola TaxID=333368 RepID=A0A2S6NA76_9HYPH|nr:class I SAM-dependent methyltransferase [Rhodoblastus sphagnicola]MBB4198870.1 SAM-dependent methyltransferase [Rhodoblastus sphagnicola]PPQ31487.1 methyltransferase [Rhodoblastus sphagnicola]
MTVTAAPASVLFSRDAAGYDDLRRRLIPCFDDFYGSALKIIGEWRTPRAFDVLDIGAGTGLFSAMALAQCNVGRLCLLDASAAMLEQARTRFAGNDRVDYRVGDMAHANLGGPWDAVISSLAIHHLSDDEKRQLYRRIHAALKPGGLFVNAEQVSGPTPSTDALYERVWLEQVRRLGAPESEIDKARERMAFDRCACVNDQIKWLEQAGFADVDCSYKAWRFAVLSGRA